MKCHLRLMVEADLTDVLEWRNHPDVRKNMYTDHEISFSEHQQWWLKNNERDTTRLLIAEINNVPVGVVTFTQIDLNNMSSSWAFYSNDVTKRGVGAHMESAALDYAFNVLGLNRLECEVLSFNETVMKFHRKFGFKLEGTKREAYCRDGQFYDIHCLSMLKKDWDKIQVQSVRAPKKVKYTSVLNQEMIATYAAVIDDHNFIHVDKDKAQQRGFNSTIAHGMLSGSLFSSIFSKTPFEPGVVYVSQELEFINPLYSGSEVIAELSLLSLCGRRATYETVVRDADTIYLKGEASVLLPKSEDDCE